MRVAVLTALLVGLTSPVAQAWTRPGHMVSAAIAYADLMHTDPDVVEQAGDLLQQHPDRGAFQVAIDRETGATRTRRMFLECARWPDDARETVYDQASWHGAFSPIAADGFSAPETIVGEAVEAFALNLKTLSNPAAPAADRAKSLCWVMHLVGDIHQPLHAAQRFSPDLPAGDYGGTRRFVLDQITNQPISLHWLWDDAVHRSGIAENAIARAAELTAMHSRQDMTYVERQARSFAGWRDESLTLARKTAYGPGFPQAPAPEAAQPVDPDYLAAVLPAARRRLTLSGYRLADLLRHALAPPG